MWTADIKCLFHLFCKAPAKPAPVKKAAAAESSSEDSSSEDEAPPSKKPKAGGVIYLFFLNHCKNNSSYFLSEKMRGINKEQCTGWSAFTDTHQLQIRRVQRPAALICPLAGVHLKLAPDALYGVKTDNWTWIHFGEEEKVIGSQIWREWQVLDLEI